jgi:hypothetical protein
MKPWPLFIGIIVILAMFCSPGLAVISKSDLIAQYEAGQFWEPANPTPSPTPTVIPTTVPTGTGTGTICVSSRPDGASVYLDGEYKGVAPDPNPGAAMVYTSQLGDNGNAYNALTGIPAGPHQLKFTKEGYKDYSKSVTVTGGETIYVYARLQISPDPTPTPTVIPTPVPTQAPPEWSSPVVPSTKPIPTPTPASGTGTFEITSTPTGAPVYLDGVYKGVTPIVITGVSGSSHILRVTLGGIDYSALITRSIFGWSSTSGGARFSFGNSHTITGPIYFHVTNQGISIWAHDPTTPIGKPNIYLYSDRDLTAQVRLAPEEAITVSDPVYQPGKGWQAEIRNGTLNGNGDFLFYEGTGPDSGWQKEEGYIIHASSREQDMASMLGPYGFNEKETSEFIEYWASHLVEDVDFVFYPQETDAVERVMPLSVSPKPDHVMRIWFYAEPLVSIPEPVTSPERIIREGFYVVEWGVIIDDEYWINHSAASSEV